MLAAGIGYGWTLAPELGLGDTAILIDQMLRLELSSHVNSHNFTLVTGWLFSHLPLGNTAVRAHSVSWFYGTVGVGLCFLLLRCWRLAPPAAALSTLVLAASHSYWWHTAHWSSRTPRTAPSSSGCCSRFTTINAPVSYTHLTLPTILLV